METVAKATPIKTAKNYAKLMRISHYIKNLLIFAPLFFGGQTFYLQKFLRNVVMFFSFCALSSVVYIINDICDIEKDRNHPKKRNRPIASGAVSIKAAIVLACVLFLVAAACNCIFINWVATVLLLLYFVLNLGYSFGWKNIPMLDIAILVSGFMLRMICGSVVSEIPISNWLYLTVFVASMFFSLGKRRNELQKHNDTTRMVLKNYPVQFLDKGMTTCLTMTNIFYALWSMEKVATSASFDRYMVFTTPLVFFITMRYTMVIESSLDGDPVDVLLHDKCLLIMCLVYVAAVFLLLYL